MAFGWNMMTKKKNLLQLWSLQQAENGFWLGPMGWKEGQLKSHHENSRRPKSHSVGLIHSERVEYLCLLKDNQIPNGNIEHTQTKKKLVEKGGE